MAVVLFMTLGCLDAKLSLNGEENGAEAVAVLMHCARPMQPHYRQPVKLVAPAHCRSRIARAFQSLSKPIYSFDDGHRLANGLNAPLLT